MKKSIYVLMFIIVLILVAMAVDGVEAKSRDGSDPVFSIGYCITPTNPNRDGSAIYAGNYLSIVDNVGDGSIATITLSGYYDFSYIDFGLESFAEDMYVIPGNFEFAWARELYELGAESQIYQVTIHGFTETIVIPSAYEAWQMFLDPGGDINPCPEPWPSHDHHELYLPLIFSP